MLKKTDSDLIEFTLLWQGLGREIVNEINRELIITDCESGCEGRNRMTRSRGGGAVCVF